MAALRRRPAFGRGEVGDIGLMSPTASPVRE
jgi:hypothetical protein